MSILKVRDKDGNFVDVPVISGRPASIKVGEVKLLEPNSEPTIENVGTEYDAIFDFGIPRGLPGNGTGTFLYPELFEKPKINDVELNDNVSLSALGIQPKGYYTKYVDDVSKLQQCKPQDVVRTLGYYEPNDGGGALYLIREKTEDDVEDKGSIHFVGDSLVAELIVENSVNVKQFGAKGDGVSDDTLPIQNSIDKLNRALIPEGVYLITTINLYKETLIKGYDRNKCVLKSKEHSYIDNDCMLLGDFTGSDGRDRVLIEDVKLDGDHKGVNGIRLFKTNSGYIHSGQHTIKNVNIQYFNRNGIYLGKGASETNIDKVDIYNCGRNGIVVETNDCVFTNVDSHNNEHNGFYINGGYNRFSDCKAWWNGRNLNAEQENRQHGFFIKTYENNLINCVAQENANHGIYIESASGITMISCSVDRNGLPMTDWNSDSPEEPYGIGLYIKDSSNIIFQGVCWDMMRWQWGLTQKYGVKLDNSNNIHINMITKDIEKDYEINSCYHINITVNGLKILTNKEKMIGEYELLNNIKTNYIQPASESGRLGYDIHSEKSLFQIYSNNDDRLRIATFIKDEKGNIQWQATPFNIYNTGDMQLGKDDKKMSFFGAAPIEKPLADGVATDLNSTIEVVNKLCDALARLGLIKR